MAGKNDFSGDEKYMNISIAMATYNGEKYIREQLDSILSQTVKDFELIVCDDCSKDSTLQILREYERKDRRIKIFENEQNLGFKKNFEKAILLCAGEYIALSDQDDIWTKDHLEKLFLIIGEHSLACGNALMVDENGKSLGKNLNEVDGLFSFNPETVFYRLAFAGNPFQGSSMLLRSDFVKKCIPIPEKIKYHDVWFSWCACMENKIAYTFDVINNYRQHGDNVSFLFHNKTKRSFLQVFLSKIKTVFTGVKIELLYRFEEIVKKYGMQKESFVEFYQVVKNIKNKKIGIKEIKFLWNHYEHITTKKGHKGFLKKLIIISKWKEE